MLIQSKTICQTINWQFPSCQLGYRNLNIANSTTNMWNLHTNLSVNHIIRDPSKLDLLETPNTLPRCCDTPYGVPFSGARTFSRENINAKRSTSGAQHASDQHAFNSFFFYCRIRKVKANVTEICNLACAESVSLTRQRLEYFTPLKRICRAFKLFIFTSLAHFASALRRYPREDRLLRSLVTPPEYF